MPNAFQAHGSQSVKPTRYVPIFTNRFFTGLWTQRSPLRDAASQYLVEKFYAGARYESLTDGLNTELSSALTLIRRFGNSVYNSQTFPAINTFYEFHQFSASGVPSIKVMADTASTVYDATGPSTQTTIFSKSAGAGQTYFQSVGNILYMGDGVDQVKWVAAPAWAANTNYPIGTGLSSTILDSNNNLQFAQYVVNFNIAKVAITSNVVTLTSAFIFTLAELSFIVGQSLFIQGLATATFLNGQTLVVLSASNVASKGTITAAFVHANYGPTADTGLATLTTGTGTSGGSPPVWNVSIGGQTADGNILWFNAGLPVQNWGITAPDTAPTLPSISTGISSGFRGWQANTALSTAHYNIIDPNGNTQFLANGGTTGPTQPTWQTAVASLTTDGTAQWINYGPLGVWQPSHAYVFGAIIDTNGNVQVVSTSGTSGSSQPSWNATPGATTTDSGVTWTNAGAGQVIVYKSHSYVYSWVNIVTGEVSTASPSATLPPVIGSSSSITVAGKGSTDTQVSATWIFRTTDGGSTFFFLNSQPSGAWSYADSLPDSALNQFIEAPVDHANDPPPVGLINLTYHLGRIWGSVGNVVYYSNGPDTLTGSGNSAFPPANSFVPPNLVTRLQPTTQGLFVFTVSDVHIIPGLGTSSDPLVEPIPLLKDIGLTSWNAFDVNGALMYLMTSDSQVVSFDPTSGVSEVGFPIGDLLQLTVAPASAYLAWHVGGSNDKALYVADGSANWFRMSQTSPPESGLNWSPKAAITGGMKCVKSVEVTPGVHKLLLGPASSGPILMRDNSVFTDNGTPYTAFATVGSIVLAQPGQLAELKFLTTESTTGGTAPTVSVLLDEISGTFESLPVGVSDPPFAPGSSTVNALRYYFSQGASPAFCRHLQIKFTWATENAQTSLMTYCINGASHEEV